MDEDTIANLAVGKAAWFIDPATDSARVTLDISRKGVEIEKIFENF